MDMMKWCLKVDILYWTRHSVPETFWIVCLYVWMQECMAIWMYEYMYVCMFSVDRIWISVCF